MAGYRYSHLDHRLRVTQRKFGERLLALGSYSFAALPERNSQIEHDNLLLVDKMKSILRKKNKVSACLSQPSSCNKLLNHAFCPYCSTCANFTRAACTRTSGG